MRAPRGHRCAAACVAVLIPFAGAVAAGHAGPAAPRPVLVLRLAPTPATPRSCARVSWVFRVSNVGSSPSRLRFRNGQRAEVVLSRAGRVVHRWSARRGFTQALWSRAVAPRTTWRFALADVLRVPAGRYSLVARLTGTTTAPSRLIVRRPLHVRAAAATCGSSAGSPPPPPAGSSPTPPPPARPPAPPPAQPPAGPPAPPPPPAAAHPPAASLTTAHGTVRLAYGSYCWMRGAPSDDVAAPCTDLIPSNAPDIPRLSVSAGETLTLRLAFEPVSLAVLLGAPGVTVRVEAEPQREVSFRVPESLRPPAAALLVVVADGSAGDLGSGQVTYLAWLTAAPE